MTMQLWRDMQDILNLRLRLTVAERQRDDALAAEDDLRREIGRLKRSMICGTADRTTVALESVAGSLEALAHPPVLLTDQPSALDKLRDLGLTEEQLQAKTQVPAAPLTTSEPVDATLEWFAKQRPLPLDALVAMEDAMWAGQAEHGDRWRTRSVAHHVGKAMGHARRGLGPTPIDADSGQPHLVLAATRMVLAVAVMRQDHAAQPSTNREDRS